MFHSSGDNIVNFLAYDPVDSCSSPKFIWQLFFWAVFMSSVVLFFGFSSRVMLSFVAISLLGLAMYSIYVSHKIREKLLPCILALILLNGYNTLMSVWASIRLLALNMVIEWQVILLIFALTVVAQLCMLLYIRKLVHGNGFTTDNQSPSLQVIVGTLAFAGVSLFWACFKNSMPQQTMLIIVLLCLAFFVYAFMYNFALNALKFYYLCVAPRMGKEQ